MTICGRGYTHPSNEKDYIYLPKHLYHMENIVVADLDAFRQILRYFPPLIYPLYCMGHSISILDGWSSELDKTWYIVGTCGRVKPDKNLLSFLAWLPG